MEYIKFNNEAKGVLSGETELIEKADLDFVGATLEEVKVEGKYVTLKIKNKKNTVTLQLDGASIMNVKFSSGKQLIIQDMEYADTEKSIFITFALENHSDYRFNCGDIEIVDVE